MGILGGSWGGCRARQHTKSPCARQPWHHGVRGRSALCPAGVATGTAHGMVPPCTASSSAPATPHPALVSPPPSVFLSILPSAPLSIHPSPSVPFSSPCSSSLCPHPPWFSSLRPPPCHPQAVPVPRAHGGGSEPCPPTPKCPTLGSPQLSMVGRQLRIGATKHGDPAGGARLCSLSRQGARGLPSRQAVAGMRPGCSLVRRAERGPPS